MQKISISQRNIGLSTIVFIVLLILKLTNNINWSWWWVFAPIWTPVCIFVVIVLVLAFVNWLR